MYVHIRQKLKVLNCPFRALRFSQMITPKFPRGKLGHCLSLMDQQVTEPFALLVSSITEKLELETWLPSAMILDMAPVGVKKSTG